MTHKFFNTDLLNNPSCPCDVLFPITELQGHCGGNEFAALKLPDLSLLKFLSSIPLTASQIFL